jgi:hypothetical protein
MDSPAEFRKRAQECLDLMPRMSLASRPILLSVAEAWLALASELEDDQRHVRAIGARSSDMH